MKNPPFQLKNDRHREDVTTDDNTTYNYLTQFNKLNDLTSIKP